MARMEEFSVKARNYKCFGKEEQGFECIKPFNVVIGRNNCGKSALLEILRFATSTPDAGSLYSIYNGNKEPEIIGDAPLVEEELLRVFNKGAAFTHSGASVWQYGQRFLGQKFKFLLNGEDRKPYLPEVITEEMKELFQYPERANLFAPKIASARLNPLRNLIFKHLAAERNISPEPHTDQYLLQNDGLGATNLIQRFLYDHDGHPSIVEDTILNDLNIILRPDSQVARILCRRNTDKQGKELWEIYLEEKDKGQIALSQSGSGLKTIFLVLTLLHIVPIVEKKSIADYIFAFEELENNLHPATLRRLLKFLYEFVHKNDCRLVLTTHSSVEIDFFSTVSDAQVIHVNHDGEKAQVQTVLDYEGSCQILNDLDLRASDLLQTNGVIWVEGPSDRLFMNKWIELWSEGELQEGLHYQCVFYGGRLLFHLDGNSPQPEKREVQILHINRNCAILIDSDKKNINSRVNQTKKRVCDGFQKDSKFAWITSGREVENYLPLAVLSEYTGKDCSDLKKFSDVFDIVKKRSGKKKLGQGCVGKRSIV